MYVNCLPIPPDMPSSITIKLPPTRHYFSMFIVSHNSPIIKISGGVGGIGHGYGLSLSLPFSTAGMALSNPPTYSIYLSTTTTASTILICNPLWWRGHVTKINYLATFTLHIFRQHFWLSSILIAGMLKGMGVG